MLVTVFDPDAPVPGGFWHSLAVIPARGSGLAAGEMPEGGRGLANSFGSTEYVGANPPVGTGTHRYFVAVTALSLAVDEVPDDVSQAMLHAVIIPATLARGVAVATADAPEG